MFFKLKKFNTDIFPVQRLSGRITVNGDKSISHRAVIFTALASGKSEIKNFLYAEDCINTLKVLKKLGVKITKKQDGTLSIEGRGRYGIKKPNGNLYFGNSGTGMRLMAGILVSQLFHSTLTGDSSLTKRPMRRITTPLKRMGAAILAREAEYPPLEIKPGTVKGITYNSPVASAQVKSCILLAGLYSDETTKVTEPYKSRDHTERMMEYFEIPVKVDGNTVSVTGGCDWPGKNIIIPGDFSSATFFITACLLIQGSSLEINNVNLNPTRTGFIDIVKKMGGNIKVGNVKEICGEPVGDIYISYTKKLKPIKISENEIPRIIDEIPLIALLATRTAGRTIIDGIGELRKKETDRLHAISTQLQNMGQSVEEQQNSLVIIGNKGALKGVQTTSFGDHRIAMMLAIAGLHAEGKTTIDDIKCINTSFPEFFNILEQIIEPHLHLDNKLYKL